MNVEDGREKKKGQGYFRLARRGAKRFYKEVWGDLWFDCEVY